MLHKISVVAAAAIMMATIGVPSADAARKERQIRSQDRSQSLSLDGRTTGRPRTCGYNSYVYDGFGVPMGPYCH